jgi:hypothetical protein
MMNDWLDKCNKVERLNFNAKAKIREGLNGASKAYYPISLEKLKSRDYDYDMKREQRQPIISVEEFFYDDPKLNNTKNTNSFAITESITFFGIFTNYLHIIFVNSILK